MGIYILRRVLYAIPIIFGVNLATFLLFFTLNTPDDMARAHLGDRYISQQQIDVYKAQHGYDKPTFYNKDAAGSGKFTDSIFYDKSRQLFLFEFGTSDAGRDISRDIKTRMWPSLALAVPTLIIGLVLNISFALLLVFFRHYQISVWAVVLTVMLMSISGLFYIILGQYIFGKLLSVAPISGYLTGVNAAKFLLLPVLVSVAAGIGSGTRWYRTIFLEEMGKDYVRTARAKGLSETVVLFKHVLKNGMIPILTGVVVILPSLFMGSLIVESFFGIPGLGSYTIDAINNQDFAIVRVMVFIGSLLYILGLLLTDISYTLVDPRVRLK